MEVGDRMREIQRAVRAQDLLPASKRPERSLYFPAQAEFLSLAKKRHPYATLSFFSEMEASGNEVNANDREVGQPTTRAAFKPGSANTASRSAWMYSQKPTVPIMPAR